MDMNDNDNAMGFQTPPRYDSDCEDSQHEWQLFLQSPGYFQPVMKLVRKDNTFPVREINFFPHLPIVEPPLLVRIENISEYESIFGKEDTPEPKLEEQVPTQKPNEKEQVPTEIPMFEEQVPTENPKEDIEPWFMINKKNQLDGDFMRSMINNDNVHMRCQRTIDDIYQGSEDFLNQPGRSGNMSPKLVNLFTRNMPKEAEVGKASKRPNDSNDDEIKKKPKLLGNNNYFI